ncbi:MAG: DUF1987 domain-containing protein [Bacteroidales bacterium]
MESLKRDPSDDSPRVVLDKAGQILEISGKSLPEDVVDFYQPILNWFHGYRADPNPKTVVTFRFIYFNTASSKMILDILMILELMVEDGRDVLVRWESSGSDDDMQQAGREYEDMVDVPFEHATFED